MATNFTAKIKNTATGGSSPEYELTAGQRIPIDASVTLNRSGDQTSPDQALWVAIRNRTEAIRFDQYADFIERVLGTGSDAGPPAVDRSAKPPGPSAGNDGRPALKVRREMLRRRPTITGGDAYLVLKHATQAFLLYETGVVIQPPRDKNNGSFGSNTDFLPAEGGRGTPFGTYDDAQKELVKYLTASTSHLPYLDNIAKALLGSTLPPEGSPFLKGMLQHRFTAPSMIELIHSYWLEQSGLEQTMKALMLRFQNFSTGPNQVLRNFAADPLRPLANLLWGYQQDEGNRLTLARRAGEYLSQYGLQLTGRAVPKFENVDSRPRFLTAFHNLLASAAQFYKEDAQTTVISDGFALLNHLRELHMILAEGACNQFGDLPSASRAEMLMIQWMLTRPEIREFLRGRPGTPYREKWMGQVEAMKRLQGWPDIGINHFGELATFGEQILLSVRYGNWVQVSDQNQARNWARYWRPEVQSYIHAYQAVTGIQLATEVVDAQQAALRSLQPSELMLRRSAPALSHEPADAVQSEFGHGMYPAVARRLPQPLRRL